MVIDVTPRKSKEEYWKISMEEAPIKKDNFKFKMSSQTLTWKTFSGEWRMSIMSYSHRPSRGSRGGRSHYASTSSIRGPRKWVRSSDTVETNTNTQQTSAWTRDDNVNVAAIAESESMNNASLPQSRSSTQSSSSNAENARKSGPILKGPAVVLPRSSTSSTGTSHKWKRSNANRGTMVPPMEAAPVETAKQESSVLNSLDQIAAYREQGATISTDNSKLGAHIPVHAQDSNKIWRKNKHSLRRLETSQVSDKDFSANEGNEDKIHECVSISGDTKQKINRDLNNTTSTTYRWVKDKEPHSTSTSTITSSLPTKSTKAPRHWEDKQYYPGPKRIRLLESSNGNTEEALKNANISQKNGGEYNDKDIHLNIEKQIESSVITKTVLTDFVYRETSKKKKGGRNQKCELEKLETRNMGLVRMKPEDASVPICPTFLRGISCINERCTKRHDIPLEAATPLCSYFQRNGQCLKREKCPFRHVKVNIGATVCPSFSLLGYCEDKNCLMKHVRQNPPANGPNKSMVLKRGSKR
jgi:hypothetical protein